MRPVFYKATFAVIVAVLVLTVAACGGDEDETPAETAAVPVASETAVPGVATTPEAQTGPPWATRAPLLVPNSEIAVAELDGKVYVVGG